MKKSEVLRTARKTLNGHWIKGDYQRDDKFCSLGAVAHALGQEEADFDIIENGWGDDDSEYSEPNPMATELRHCLENIISQQYPEYGVTGSTFIPTWNDDERRTEDEVLAIFDKAILGLEEAGE